MIYDLICYVTTQTHDEAHTEIHGPYIMGEVQQCKI